MTWDFEGDAENLRDIITCVRNADAVDNDDLNRLLDALLPYAIIGSVNNHFIADLGSKYTALLCGAFSNDSAQARCNMAPHASRWHTERGPNDELLAEWTSVVSKDDDERLWPDGTIGPRLRKRS